MILGIDFDGTIVKHMFPSIGDPVEGSFHYMKEFQKLGARLILWTMRSDGACKDNTDRKVLTEAINFCREKGGIEFWSHNTNPEQASWTGSPKCYCNYYIDDAAIGCPLVYPTDGRPYVDWSKVGPMVLKIMNEK